MTARTKISVGLIISALFALLGLFGAWIAPELPETKHLTEQLLRPSGKHLFGQNHHGQDLLSIIIHGARVSLLVGVVVVTVSATLGSILGLCAGYLRGWFDNVISRIIDIVLAFPGILLAIAITAVLGPSLFNVILALVFGGWVTFARLVRAQTYSLRERPYIVAARALGMNNFRIMLRHILPNLSGILLVQGTFSLAVAILAESSLSFLGLGVPPDMPSWGGAMRDGVRYLLQAPHMALFPGLAIMLTVLAFNFLGDGLRDYVAKR